MERDPSPAAVPDVTALAQTIRRVLRVMDGSEFKFDDFPTMRDAQAAGEALAALLALVERLTLDNALVHGANELHYRRWRETQAELEQTRQERDDARHSRDAIARTLTQSANYERDRCITAERERDEAQAREQRAVIREDGLRDALDAIRNVPYGRFSTKADYAAFIRDLACNALAALVVAGRPPTEKETTHPQDHNLSIAREVPR